MLDRKIEKRQRRRFIDCDNGKFARKDSISLKCKESSESGKA